jgi:broad specificity phosphatase PhoE
MELVLLRHAQPGWTDEENRGVSDPGLTPLGLEKAGELASCLGTEPFNSILVSSYRRCQETARAVFGDSDERLRVEDWLREITLPDFSQQPAEQVIKFFKEAKSRPLSSWWDGMPGGESFRDFHARIRDGLTSYLATLGIRRLRPGHKDDMHLFSIDAEAYRKRHLIVSHLGSTGLILSELLHLELVPWVWESFCLDWNGVVRLETARVADGYIFCLRSFNEKGHRDPSLGLPPEGVTSSSS